MKKIMAVMLSLLACTVLLAGCNTSSESNEEQSLKVYSFSGENEYISVSNGVIILDGKDEICYGGDLKVMSDDFSDITTYSTTIYINGSEKEISLSIMVPLHISISYLFFFCVASIISFPAILFQIPLFSRTAHPHLQKNRYNL